MKLYNNILLHIPHANPNLHSNMGELLVSIEELEKFSNLISDLEVDDLFSHGIGIKYKATYSRVYCDVEKFLDDSLEVMRKYGQGVFYLKDHKGRKIRRVTNDYKEKVLLEYYYPYHKGLDDLTLSLLNKKLIIVDCHSFSEELVLHNKSSNYPDIDIGFDMQYYSKDLVEGVKEIFVNNGYKVSFNFPYEGTLIPNAIYNKNIPNVYCLMIEINKKIYLNNQKDYQKCKSTIKEVLEFIKSFS